MDFGKTKSIQSTIKENWYVCDPNKAVWIVARGTQWLLEKICSHITHTGIFFKMSFRILSTAKMQIVQNTRDFERFFFRNTWSLINHSWVIGILWRGYTKRHSIVGAEATGQKCMQDTAKLAVKILKSWANETIPWEDLV